MSAKLDHVQYSRLIVLLILIVKSSISICPGVSRLAVYFALGLGRMLLLVKIILVYVGL